MLLEKAWAKVYGSYSRIVGGLTALASQHLTGMPALHIRHSDVNDDPSAFFK